MKLCNGRRKPKPLCVLVFVTKGFNLAIQIQAFCLYSDAKGLSGKNWSLRRGEETTPCCRTYFMLMSSLKGWKETPPGHTLHWRQLWSCHLSLSDDCKLFHTTMSLKWLLHAPNSDSACWNMPNAYGIWLFWDVQLPLNSSERRAPRLPLPLHVNVFWCYGHSAILPRWFVP